MDAAFGPNHLSLTHLEVFLQNTYFNIFMTHLEVTLRKLYFNIFIPLEVPLQNVYFNTLMIYFYTFGGNFTKCIFQYIYDISLYVWR